ncbi:hypothetical protein HYH02_008779 [Chlamydomonas schloesseri]|uniref:Uncharacterized protein n=1 Tax=Chlamydomonas schloesseri TaxID=2026947 RepID=A0A836B2C1_9CHLO|nr:hypothetical protein HYH02_008779 [Chlamydomonas schloesseri]|eukprot:KAG2445313.1 hypothetical protein HYH02_008779 [Chlamydomonas schloesseri]
MLGLRALHAVAGASSRPAAGCGGVATTRGATSGACSGARPALASARKSEASHGPVPAARRHSHPNFNVSAAAAPSSGSAGAVVSAAGGSAAGAAVDRSGLVFSTGAAGSWDEAAVGSPVVRCYVGDDEQRWFMWYSGRRADSPAAGGVDAIAPSSGSVGVAISRDGITWQRGFDTIEGSRGADAASDVGSVMHPNKDWWTFDTCHLAPGDVQVLSNSSVSSGVGVYWMFYSGGDFEPVQLPQGLPAAGAAVAPPPEGVEGLRMRPGLAMSQDGRNWARIEADHHTGALFDVGGEGEADQLCVRSPQVVNLGPRDMRMFYTSWDVSRRRFVVCMATSPDGFKWTKKGVVFDPAALSAAAAAASSDEDPGASSAFDALGPASVSVVRDVDNRQLLMFYEAVGYDNRRSIGLAVSKDGGAVWRRYGAPVLEAAEGGEAAAAAAWDGGDVGHPCAVSMSAGRWRLYYTGRQTSGSGPWNGIGLALSVEGGPSFEGVPVAYRRRAPTAKPAAEGSAQ